MYEQSTPAPTGDTIEGVTLTQKFEAFDGANQHFQPELVKLARRFLDKTGRTCGIQRLIEIARWDIEMTLDTDDEFQINNDFAAFYARKIMVENPDLLGFFRLRRAVEANEWLWANYPPDIVAKVLGIDDTAAAA